MQQTNERQRTKMRLSEIEKIIRKERIMVPPPSRSKLIALIEDGTFETAGRAPTRFGWLVYEDSFRRWITSLDAE